MRLGCEKWLADLGVEQRGIGEVPPAQVAAQVDRGEWFVGVDASDVTVGALRYLCVDHDVWPGAADGVRYVHGLMTERRVAAPGSGASLLAWAERRAIAEGVSVLRLDCVESNRRLRDFYGALGYREVGRRDFDGAWLSATLFEKCLAL